MPIIAIEGPDDSGKTTLGIRLAKDLNGLFVKPHVRPVDQHFLEMYVGWLRINELKWGWIVTDRHPAISEVVYGTVLRGRVAVDPWYAANCLNETIMVYCPNSNRTWSEEQLDGVADRIRLLEAEYDKMFRWSTRHRYRAVYRWDYKTNDYQFLLNAIRNTK